MKTSWMSWGRSSVRSPSLHLGLGRRGRAIERDLRVCECVLLVRAEAKLPHMPEEARLSAQREMKRLKRIPPSSMEHSMLLSWVEWVIDLPWGEETQDRLDVQVWSTPELTCPM